MRWCVCRVEENHGIDANEFPEDLKLDKEEVSHTPCLFWHLDYLVSRHFRIAVKQVLVSWLSRLHWFNNRVRARKKKRRKGKKRRKAKANWKKRRAKTKKAWTRVKVRLCLLVGTSTLCPVASADICNYAGSVSLPAIV